MYNIRIDNLHAMLAARPPRSLLAILVSATRGTRLAPPLLYYIEALLQRLLFRVQSQSSTNQPNKFSRRQIFFFTLSLLFVAGFGRSFEVNSSPRYFIRPPPSSSNTVQVSSTDAGTARVHASSTTFSSLAKSVAARVPRFPPRGGPRGWRVHVRS